ncbi:MAG: class I SAM-dependent methyltransferase [Legionellaceae bacterium]|nr:class I SAM-dependent methyltransferase [Legionellaceae bacterium]
MSETLHANFYKSFEDKYRGSRELIKSRLQVYKPFIKSIQDIYPNSKTIDLGCGRCEWLEILTQSGFKATGVDRDENMLSLGVELGLDVHCANALDFLKNVDDNSQSIVSAFHLVEHIEFEELQTLVFEALRVLRPGGLLIMETPNPENIVVGTCAFYMDPTHKRPIPPNLLAFLPEYYGYKNYKILRLQESKDLMKSLRFKLMDVLNGASPDYAVIAQKDAESDLLNITNSAFEKNYGLTLEQLAATYQRGINVQWIKNKFKRNL